jgi:hypothetical protein
MLAHSKIKIDIQQKKKINAKTQGRKDFEKLNKIEIVFIQLSTVNKHFLKAIFYSLRLRSCLEIQTLRRTRSKKVARRETSGSSRASFRALKERKNFFPRLQRGKSIADLFQTFHVWLLSQCHFVAENNFQTVS